MASLSPVMVFPPASLVLVSWGCVLGFAKATAHLSGIVLLSSDPYVKVMGSLINYVCKYTDLYPTSIPILHIISSYRMFNPDPATHCFWSCF